MAVQTDGASVEGAVFSPKYISVGLRVYLTMTSFNPVSTIIDMAAMALSNDAWTKARERFIEDLEEPERLMFAEASLENIFYSASAAQKVHQEGSRSLYLASKLDILLAGIDQYGKAMDVLSQASPFLCPLWGALRVVIHVSALVPHAR